MTTMKFTDPEDILREGARPGPQGPEFAPEVLEGLTELEIRAGEESTVYVGRKGRETVVMGCVPTGE